MTHGYDEQHEMKQNVLKSWLRKTMTLQILAIQQQGQKQCVIHHDTAQHSIPISNWVGGTQTIFGKLQKKYILLIAAFQFGILLFCKNWLWSIIVNPCQYLFMMVNRCSTQRETGTPNQSPNSYRAGSRDVNNTSILVVDVYDPARHSWYIYPRFSTAGSYPQLYQSSTSNSSPLVGWFILTHQGGTNHHSLLTS